MAKKKFVRRQLQSISAYEFEGSLESLMEKFIHLRNKYTDHQNLSIELFDEYPEFALYGNRLETDKEFNRRLDTEKRQRERVKKERERKKAVKYQEYLKLKAEFESESS